ncbi:hypothetical protein LOTGIDRAFT_158582 [Lottia gigantea]|uniref:Uncharacterized protein n=1 Tax=Lottia gigantea TaxID=225164 RepID=V4AWT6_LOTGI|nr:hypothetical protein LOTGIDRAFT_158582 [Lottia gigantea]ESO99490.1 hypothetical protein LOTGIDRAFT_158582 [Lottia gigantea]
MAALRKQHVIFVLVSIILLENSALNNGQDLKQQSIPKKISHNILDDPDTPQQKQTKPTQKPYAEKSGPKVNDPLIKQFQEQEKRILNSLNRVKRIYETQMEKYRREYNSLTPVQIKTRERYINYIAKVRETYSNMRKQNAAKMSKRFNEIRLMQNQTASSSLVRKTPANEKPIPKISPKPTIFIPLESSNDVSDTAVSNKGSSGVSDTNRTVSNKGFSGVSDTTVSSKGVSGVSDTNRTVSNKGTSDVSNTTVSSKGASGVSDTNRTVSNKGFSGVSDTTVSSKGASGVSDTNRTVSNKGTSDVSNTTVSSKGASGVSDTNRTVSNKGSSGVPDTNRTISNRGTTSVSDTNRNVFNKTANRTDPNKDYSGDSDTDVYDKGSSSAHDTNRIVLKKGAIGFSDTNVFNKGASGVLGANRIVSNKDVASNSNRGLNGVSRRVVRNKIGSDNKILSRTIIPSAKHDSAFNEDFKSEMKSTDLFGIYHILLDELKNMTTSKNQEKVVGRKDHKIVMVKFPVDDLSHKDRSMNRPQNNKEQNIVLTKNEEFDYIGNDADNKE